MTDLHHHAGSFCRFFTQRHGNAIFAEYGTSGKKVRWNEDPTVEAFNRVAAAMQVLYKSFMLGQYETVTVSCQH